MQKTKCLRAFLMIMMAFLAISCSEFKKIQESTNWQEKYTAALRYYENKEYYKAGLLLDQVIPVINGTLDAEKATFYRAQSYFHQGKFILSGNYFKEFAIVYSRSEYAEEAEYLSAYSAYLQSPIYNLDQSSTYSAVDEFQSFINTHPGSERSENATRFIDELQRKLETKAFENARQYYKLERWDAARVTFESFADDFPDSKLNEEVLFLAMKSEYSYAKQSIKSKQKERFEKTKEIYEKFIDKYPNSELLQDLEGFYIDSMKQLKKLSNNS